MTAPASKGQLSRIDTSAIEVYRNNYRGNLHGTLVGAYLVIEQLVDATIYRATSLK